MTTTTYQSVCLSYYDGKFVSATLFLTVDINEVELINHYLTIRDFKEAMKTLRSIEKLAGHSAEMTESRYYDNNHHKFYSMPATETHTVVSKFISHLTCDSQY